MKRMFRAAAMAGGILFATTSALAANLAIFGNNNIGSLYSEEGHSVSFVSDDDLAASGFLDAFDAFIYTRDGFSFGSGLSAAAAANVKDFVVGNVVLFNGDFQDDIGDPNTDLLFNNALAYVLSGGPGGYIGEYRGSFAAFSSNDDGNNPIGLVNGHAGVSGFGQGGSDGDVQVTSAGLASGVTGGVTFPYNPGAVEFGAAVDGVNPDKVLARFDNGNPAIVASSIGEISAGVPEPATWAMMLTGFGLIGGSMRRRRAPSAVLA